ncbi:MAG: hypothetical protein NUW12_11555 [Firmicutes bacterium]|nr:hypothetical protein [Bacillota bacterium]MDH7496628.1 hypothetical protein [Bacillota bacterium]
MSIAIQHPARILRDLVFKPQTAIRGGLAGSLLSLIVIVAGHES